MYRNKRYTVNSSVRIVRHSAVPYNKQASKYFTVYLGELTGYDGTSEKVIIPGHVKRIGSRAFAGKRGILEVILPEGVASIGAEAFIGCGDLREITIPQSVTNIESGAFAFCRSLEKVTFAGADATIQKNVFAECTGLKQFVFHWGALLPEELTELLLGDSGISVDFRSGPEGTKPRLSAALFYLLKPKAEYTEREHEAYCRCLMNNNKKLKNMAVINQRLLSGMCSKKLITAENYGEYLAAAQKTEDTEINATLLGYRKTIEAELEEYARKQEELEDRRLEKLFGADDPDRF